MWFLVLLWLLFITGGFLLVQKESSNNITLVSSPQVTGRTWLDVFTAGRYKIMLIVLILGLVVFILIKPDIFTGVISGIQDNSHYFLAIAI